MNWTLIVVALISAGASLGTALIAVLVRRENKAQHGSVAELLLEHTVQDAENFGLIQSELREIRRAVEPQVISEAAEIDVRAVLAPYVAR